MYSILTSIFCVLLTFLIWCWGFRVIDAIKSNQYVQRRVSVFIFMVFNHYIIFRQLMQIELPTMLRIVHGLFISFLLLMSLIDTYTCCISNHHLIICLILALLQRWLNPLTQNHFYLLVCVVPLTLIGLRHKEYLGFGDVILLIICATYLNVLSFYITLAIAVISASGVSILLIVMGRRSLQDAIPFVPFITFGFVMTLLFDAPIWFGFP